MAFGKVNVGGKYSKNSYINNLENLGEYETQTIVSKIHSSNVEDVKFSNVENALYILTSSTLEKYDLDLNLIVSIAVDSSKCFEFDNVGNIYLVYLFNLKKLDKDLTQIWDKANITNLGYISLKRFAVDDANNVYLPDTAEKIIRKITKDGNFIKGSEVFSDRPSNTTYVNGVVITQAGSRIRAVDTEFLNTIWEGNYNFPYETLENFIVNKDGNMILPSNGNNAGNSLQTGISSTSTSSMYSNNEILFVSTYNSKDQRVLISLYKKNNNTLLCTENLIIPYIAGATFSTGNINISFKDDLLCITNTSYNIIWILKLLGRKILK